MNSHTKIALCTLMLISGIMGDFAGNGYVHATNDQQNEEAPVKGGVLTRGAARNFMDKYGHVSIPRSVKSIGYGAFEGCTELRSVNIPDSVTSIDRCAFDGCKKLKKIIVPKSIIPILKNVHTNNAKIINEESFFDRYPRLIVSKYLNSIDDYRNFTQTSTTSSNIFKQLRFNPISLDPKKVGYFPNIQTLHLYNQDDINAFLKYKPENIVSSLEEGDLKKAGGKFDHIEIHIPVKSEDFNVYKDKLNHLLSGTGSIKFLNVIANKAEHIGHVDKNTRKFEFNKNCIIREIGDGCFEDMRDIKSIDIPNSVTSIGWHAFNGCTGLIEITIPNSVTSIGWHAFNGCTGLTEITIPNSVTSIGCCAFEGCTSADITLLCNNASVARGEFNGCKTVTVVSKTMRKILSERGISSSLNEKLRPKSDQWIWNVDNGVLTIPDNVTNISRYMFYKRDDIERVEVPAGVTSIDWWAFKGCTGLTEITIPNSVTYIDNGAFEGCTSANITLLCNSADVDIDAFIGCKKIIVVSETMKKILYDRYVRYVVLDKSLRPEIDNWIWDNVEDGVLTIPKHITDISNYMFYKRNDIKCVEIPAGVTSICSNAFARCIGLTEITIPDSVTSICWGAFYGCTSLDSINVHSERVRELVLRSTSPFLDPGSFNPDIVRVIDNETVNAKPDWRFCIVN